MLLMVDFVIEDLVQQYARIANNEPSRLEEDLILLSMFSEELGVGF
jgi:hypothetical protein